MSTTYKRTIDAIVLTVVLVLLYMVLQVVQFRFNPTARERLQQLNTIEAQMESLEVRLDSLITLWASDLTPQQLDSLMEVNDTTLQLKR